MAQPQLLITRPREEQRRTAEAARAAGFRPVAAPVLRVESLPFDLPDHLPPKLLFTSARAPAYVAARYPALRERPVYAVGRHTAAAAQAAGFAICGQGDRDGNAIVAAASAAGDRHLLHLSGEQRAHFHVPDGMVVERRAVYRAIAADRLPDAAIEALHDGAHVLLMSPRSAAIFAALADYAGLDRRLIGLAVISAAAARVVGAGWRTIHVAERPDLDASLAAARLL